MIIGILLFTVDGLGQNTWVKTYGGSESEGGCSITYTSDGGYIVTGYTYSNNGDFNGMNKGSGDIFVMKLNSFGEVEWEITLGGELYEQGYSITTTNDGGYIISGFTYSNNGDFSGMNNGFHDIFVIKLNTTGKVQWKKTFGGNLPDGSKSLVTTKDNGYILTGFSYSNNNDFNGMNKGSSDVFVIKLNFDGDLIWKKTFGGSEDDSGNSIITTNDGGFVITGNTYSNNLNFNLKKNDSSDIFVMKIDSDGDILWNKILGGSGNELGNSITSTSDDGYVLTGTTSSNDGDFNGMNKGNQDIFVVKLDSIGNIEWKKTFGGSGNEQGNTITTTDDGKFLFTGVTTSIDGDFVSLKPEGNNIFVMLLEPTGDTVWNRTFGGSGFDYGWSITTTTDGGFVLTGRTFSNDGDFSGMNKGSSDLLVMKLDSNGNLNNTSSINEFSEPTTTLSVHPNPFHNSTTVSYKVDTPSNVRIELLNTLGQTVEVLREDYTDIGTYQLPLNVSTLSSGMYSVRMKSGSMSEVVPVWVVR